MATCFCGEDLNDAGECWRGMFNGGHRGNCIICGKNADLDGLKCCSEECDVKANEIADEWDVFDDYIELED